MLAVELLSPDRFCVYVDHPDGVDHALCARVTDLLARYRGEYTIDVSSPGLDRPLRTPAHFRNAVGRTVSLRTAHEVAGRTKFRGEVVGAGERAVSLATGGGEPLDDPVRRDRAGQPDPREVGHEPGDRRGIRALEREKGIEEGTLVSALEDALLAAYKKTPGASRHAAVELDDEGDFRVFSIEIPSDLEARLLEEASEAKIDELERLEEETGEKKHTLINDDELDLDWSQVPEQQIARADVTPDNFGRIAAQTAKQVIQQRIREAEREMMYDEYVDRVGEVVTGIVQQAGDRNNVLVDLGKVEALLPRSEQVDGERYEQGSRIKAVITEVRSGTKGPQVILSRRDPELIKTLFELEVPEIADGLVEIRGVAREPGYRSKIAVESHAQGVDPVGACVGPRGSRVRMVVSELRGEKIDIIPWNTEPARFVAKALSPARVREVYIDDETREATVVVPDDQLALAIGKEGLNARLAARLTGWKIDIQSDTEFAQAEADAAFAGDVGRGRRGLLGPLRGDPLERQALPERRAAGLALLRRARAPGARAAGRPPGRSAAEPVEAALAAPRRCAEEAGRRGAVAEHGHERWRAGLEDAAGRGDRRARRGGGAALRDAGPHLRGLRPQGAAGGARPLRRGRAARWRRAAALSGRGRLHLPPARLLRAGARAQARFNRVLRQTVTVDPALARLYTDA